MRSNNCGGLELTFPPSECLVGCLPPRHGETARRAGQSEASSPPSSPGMGVWPNSERLRTNINLAHSNNPYAPRVCLDFPASFAVACYSAHTLLVPGNNEVAFTLDRRVNIPDSFPRAHSYFLQTYPSHRCGRAPPSFRRSKA